eukprot:958257-Lingulodinium_polyedra.AAC.1
MYEWKNRFWCVLLLDRGSGGRGWERQRCQQAPCPALAHVRGHAHEGLQVRHPGHKVDVHLALVRVDRVGLLCWGPRHRRPPPGSGQGCRQKGGQDRHSLLLRPCLQSAGPADHEAEERRSAGR